MQVIKRNKSLEEFDKDKIYKAVMKAAIATDQENFDYEAHAIAGQLRLLSCSVRSVSKSVTKQIVTQT